MPVTVAQLRRPLLYSYLHGRRGAGGTVSLNGSENLCAAWLQRTGMKAAWGLAVCCFSLTAPEVLAVQPYVNLKRGVFKCQWVRGLLLRVLLRPQAGTSGLSGPQPATGSGIVGTSTSRWPGRHAGGPGRGRRCHWQWRNASVRVRVNWRLAGVIHTAATPSPRGYHSSSSAAAREYSFLDDLPVFAFLLDLPAFAFLLELTIITAPSSSGVSASSASPVPQQARFVRPKHLVHALSPSMHPIAPKQPTTAATAVSHSGTLSGEVPAWELLLLLFDGVAVVAIDGAGPLIGGASSGAVEGAEATSDAITEDIETRSRAIVKGAITQGERVIIIKLKSTQGWSPSDSH